MTHDVPHLPWQDFVAQLDWRQGEHTTLIGPTGQGKTTLGKELLRYREARRGHIVLVATKPRDRNLMAGLRGRGYRRIRDWPPGARDNRVILWPQYRQPGDDQEQARAIESAFSAIFDQGHWCVYVDELPWLLRIGLDDWLTALWMQGRALDVTVVASTQRPRHVPLAAYSSSTHLFFWRTNDEQDLRRIGGLGVLSSAAIRDTVSALPRYHVCYVDTRGSGELVTTVAPNPDTKG